MYVISQHGVYINVVGNNYLLLDVHLSPAFKEFDDYKIVHTFM